MPLVPSDPQTGSQLRLWRRHRGLTQQELAASLGVSASTIGRWERGDSALHPDIRALFREPPLLTLKTRRRKREPTKAQLALAKKSLDDLAETSKALKASYARVIADTVEQVQRAIGGDAVAQMIRSVASQVTPMPDVLVSVDWPRIQALGLGIREIADSYERLLRPLMAQVASVGQFIAAAFPTDEEFKRVSSTMADRGWFLGAAFPLGMVRQIDTLLATGDDDGVESLMQDYVRERLGDILAAAAERCPPRASILKSAMTAHEEERYELSVPALLAQADGIAGDLLGGHLFRRVRNTEKTRASRKLDEKLAGPRPRTRLRRGEHRDPHPRPRQEAGGGPPIRPTQQAWRTPWPRPRLRY